MRYLGNYVIVRLLSFFLCIGCQILLVVLRNIIATFLDFVHVEVDDKQESSCAMASVCNIK